MAVSNVVALYTSGSSLPSTTRSTAVTRGLTARNDAEPFRFVIQGAFIATDPNGESYVPTFVFPVSPNEVNTQGLGIAYEELERPGRKGLMQARAEKLMQVSATFFIHSISNPYVGNCEAELKVLEEFANVDLDIAIYYPGIPQGYLWRITDYTTRTVRRNQRNRVTMAEASITFTESRWSEINPVVPGMAVIKDVPWDNSTTDEDQRDDKDELEIDVQPTIDAGNGVSALASALNQIGNND